jgi:hypothetical protein
LTFLLFLVSIAVLEYIVCRRQPKGTTEDSQPPAEITSPAEDEDRWKAGLAALSEAVERHGRGESPRHFESDLKLPKNEAR